MQSLSLLFLQKFCPIPSIFFRHLPIAWSRRTLMSNFAWRDLSVHVLRDEERTSCHKPLLALSISPLDACLDLNGLLDCRSEDQCTGAIFYQDTSAHGWGTSEMRTAQTDGRSLADFKNSFVAFERPAFSSLRKPDGSRTTEERQIG